MQAFLFLTYKIRMFLFDEAQWQSPCTAPLQFLLVEMQSWHQGTWLASYWKLQHTQDCAMLDKRSKGFIDVFPYFCRNPFTTNLASFQQPRHLHRCPLFSWCLITFLLWLWRDWQSSSYKRFKIRISIRLLLAFLHSSKWATCLTETFLPDDPYFAACKVFVR